MKENKSFMDVLDEMPSCLGAIVFAIVVVGGAMAIITLMFGIVMLIGSLFGAPL